MDPPPIFKLNTDCLLEIFSYFHLREIEPLELVCKRFQEVAQDAYRRYRTLDFDKLKDDCFYPVMLTEAKQIARWVGPHVSTLKAKREAFKGYDDEAGRHEPDENIIEYILSKCTKNLEHIVIEGFNLSSCIGLLCEIADNLKTIKLERCQLNDDIGVVLKRATKLESLSLRGNEKILGTFLPDLKNLQELNLQGCQKLHANHFIAFCRSNGNLRYLNLISWENVNQKCLRKIRGLQFLETLKIGHLMNKSGDLLILKDLPRLQDLELRCTNVDKLPTFLDSLVTSERLRYLDLYFRGTPRALKSLTMFKSLKLLDIGHADFRNPVLMKLSCKDTLEELNISQNRCITSKFLCQFVLQCPKLKLIDIRECRNISDKFVEDLLPHLHERSVHLEVKAAQSKISKDVEWKYNLHTHPKIQFNWSHECPEHLFTYFWDDSCDEEIDVEDDDEDYHPGFD
ncbi:hypothetical protein DMENIID0001_030170 [Sergentomyia squamirostris]